MLFRVNAMWRLSRNRRPGASETTIVSLKGSWLLGVSAQNCGVGGAVLQ